MSRRNPTPRLPLREALRVYWPWLLGLVVAAAITFFIPNPREHFSVIAVFFFCGAFMAAYPWLRLNAPYSFWVFAGVLWLILGLVFPAVAALFR